MIRKYGSKMKIEAASPVMEEVLRDVEKQKPEIIESKHKDFLYFRSRAISAGDQGPVKGEPNPNGNGDYFPRKELESSYKTFENRQLFLNHESDHPVKSVGKIISAEAIEDPDTGEFYIECLAKIDKKLHPEIARKIETGELNTVSMGCSCKESMCSICGTEIFSDEDEKCQHLSPVGLGKVYNAEIDLPEYGIQRGQPMQAFSINKGLDFNELSIVSVPADDQAIIKTVLANAKHSLSKDASLSQEDKLGIMSQVEAILQKLDVETQKKFKEEICACELPKEDSKMSKEKATSKSNDFNNKEAFKLSEEDHVNMILDQKLTALDHIRLLDSYKKRVEKEAEERKQKEIPVEDTKIETNLIKRIADKVKSAIKFAVSDPKPQPKSEAQKEAKTTIIAKYDKKNQSWALFNGESKLVEAKVADLWNKEKLANKEFFKQVTSNLYGNALVARYNKIGPEKFAKILGLAYKQMDVKDSKVTEPKKSEFTKPGEKSSADKEHDKSKTAIEKADEETPGQHLEKHEEPIAEKKEVSNKTAKHKDDCSCNFCKNIKKDKSEKKDDDKKDDKEASNKEADKKCLNCNKQLDDCTCDPSQTKTDKKDHSVKQEAKKEAAIEMPPEEHTEQLPENEPEVTDVEKPKESPDVKMPADPEKPESVFDKIDQPIILGDGYEASKDPETGEIVVTKAGEEIQRMPDAFSTEVADVMKLMQSILGVQTEETIPGKVEEPAVVHEEHTPLTDISPEKAQEETPELAMASKKDTINKEAQQKLSKKEAELKEKEDKLKEKEATLKVEEDKAKARQFGSSISGRVERCKKIVYAMLKKDLLEIDENVVTAALDQGEKALDARQVGLKHAVNRQIKELMALDDLLLEKFAKSINNVKTKKVANRLTTPLSIAYEETNTVDTELNNIFSSMGSKGGSQNFQ